LQGAGGGAVRREIGRLFGPGTVAGLSEGQLLARFHERGDAVAFEAIVSRHGPMVLGVCRRALRDANDVEDAFQATFLVLVRRAGAIRRREQLGPWLYGVARRVATRARNDAMRRPKLRVDADPDANALDIGFEAPDDLERREALAALHEEVGRLPEKYRAPIVLCYLEGLTHDEATARLRWPVGTVRGRLARARDRLRDRLARRGAVPSAALLGMLAASRDISARAIVPESLTRTTVEAATRVASGQTLAGAVSARVAAWTKGVLNAMLLNHLKWTALLAAVGLVTVGSGAPALQLQGPGKSTEVRNAGTEPPPKLLARSSGPSIPNEQGTEPLKSKAGEAPAPTDPEVGKEDRKKDGAIDVDEQVRTLALARGRIEALELDIEIEKSLLYKIRDLFFSLDFEPESRTSRPNPDARQERLNIEQRKNRLEKSYKFLKEQYIENKADLARALHGLHQTEREIEKTLGKDRMEELRRSFQGLSKTPPRGSPLNPTTVLDTPPQFEHRLNEIESKLDRLLKAVEGDKKDR
jgi:RNA polymerase sigma factor (sigma-70 family)